MINVDYVASGPDLGEQKTCTGETERNHQSRPPSLHTIYRGPSRRHDISLEACA